MVMETKKERFIRIAEARTNRVIDQLRLLGNCSNRNNYEYDEESVKKIFGTIERELRNCKAKFKNVPLDKFTLK